MAVPGQLSNLEKLPLIPSLTIAKFGYNFEQLSLLGSSCKCVLYIAIWLEDFLEYFSGAF